MKHLQKAENSDFQNTKNTLKKSGFSNENFSEFSEEDVMLFRRSVRAQERAFDVFLSDPDGSIYRVRDGAVIMGAKRIDVL